MVYNKDKDKKMQKHTKGEQQCLQIQPDPRMRRSMLWTG